MYIIYVACSLIGDRGLGIREDLELEHRKLDQLVGIYDKGSHCIY